MLTKWAWRFKTQQGSLWRNVIEAIHGGKNKWIFLPVTRNLTGCWKSLVVALDQIQINGKQVSWFFKGKLGNGDYLCFWKDRWLGEKLLMDRWPKLFLLENKKNCSISDRLKRTGPVCTLAAGWNA